MDYISEDEFNTTIATHSSTNSAKAAYFNGKPQPQTFKL